MKVEFNKKTIAGIGAVAIIVAVVLVWQLGLLRPYSIYGAAQKLPVETRYDDDCWILFSRVEKQDSGLVGWYVGDFKTVLEAGTSTMYKGEPVVAESEVGVLFEPLYDSLQADLDEYDTEFRVWPETKSGVNQHESLSSYIADSWDSIAFYNIGCYKNNSLLEETGDTPVVPYGSNEFTLDDVEVSMQSLPANEYDLPELVFVLDSGGNPHAFTETSLTQWLSAWSAYVNSQTGQTQPYTFSEFWSISTSEGLVPPEFNPAQYYRDAVFTVSSDENDLIKITMVVPNFNFAGTISVEIPAELVESKTPSESPSTEQPSDETPSDSTSSDTESPSADSDSSFTTEEPETEPSELTDIIVLTIILIIVGIVMLTLWAFTDVFADLSIGGK